MRNCASILIGIGLTVFAANATQAQVTTDENVQNVAVSSIIEDVADKKIEQNRVEERVERKAIPAPTHYEFSRQVGPGRLLKKSEGKPGELIRTYRVEFKGGKPTSKKLVSEKRVQPVAAVILMGKSGYTSSRHKFTRSKVLDMHASAYTPKPKGGSGITSMGLPAMYGLVAVDPKVIPLGTRLYIEGYGFAVAADTGGAIKGNKIDLCVPTYAKAMQFGRKKVRVHILH